jgi:hypothetical protein
MTTPGAREVEHVVIWIEELADDEVILVVVGWPLLAHVPTALDRLPRRQQTQTPASASKSTNSSLPRLASLELDRADRHDHQVGDKHDRQDGCLMARVLGLAYSPYLAR